MKVTTRAVRDIAKNAGVPEEIVDRNLDAFINLTFAIAKRERKQCRKIVRKWLHSGDVIKPNILDVLTEELENEDELYDIL